MQTLSWYFDFVSPFSYLQSEHLHRLPADATVIFKPVLLGVVLQHWQSLGPAEIMPKRRFTYRYLLWLARRCGVPFRMPPVHPFNPLKALRLAIALDCRPNVIRDIFRYCWRDGHSIDDASAWAALLDHFGLADAEAAITAPEVKQTLQNNTQEAIDLEIFGVPTFVVDGEIFWGFDATDMLLDYLAEPTLFQDAEMQRISTLPMGVQRK